MKTFYRFIFSIVMLVTVVVTPLKAQWNTNTSVNITISSLPVADMQSVATTDGKTWIAFYHENGGNYDMRAQLIDANGYKLLGTDGVLVNNHTSGSATFVFNVCIDASNNLIIGMQDERSGSTGAVLYKISEAGTQLWGANGIVLGGGLSPYPAVLSNGEVAVAWSETSSNTCNLQKITTSGTLAWGSSIPITVGSTGTTRGQIIANTAGKFTVVYQMKGFGVSTTLYAQMFSNSGTALYSPLQISSQTTSAARYYSIQASGDTTFFSYYASAGSRFNCFLQRINPGGTIPWGMNGSNFNTSTGSSDPNQMETSINLTPGLGHVWSVCTFSNSSQTQYGIYVQKYNRVTGARLLTDGAKVVFPIAATNERQVGALALTYDDPMFMLYDVNDKIYATRVNSLGNFVWPGNRVEISSTTSTGKMRYGFTPDGPNRCAGVWTENRGTAYMGYAQGVSVGGLIGIVVATQGGVPATITTPGGTLQMVATVYPSTASQSVTWSIVPVTGQASISTGGLVTAIANGTVYAKAISVQDVTMRDSLLITISNQGPMAPTVVTNAASSITNTTATLNGTVTANSAATTVTFQWGTTTSYGNTVGATPGTVNGTTPTAVSANIGSLTYGTTYHYRCVGTNSVNTTNGNDMTFVAGCTPLISIGTITGPASVCVNATGVVYSVAPVTNATGYVWSVPAGANITIGQNTTSITVTFGTASGNVSVYATNICSQTTPSVLAVAVTPPPVPVITGSANACEFSTNVIYTTDPGMTNYVWNISSGGTINSGTGTNQIQVTWNTTGAQWVSVNYTGTSGCSATNPTTYNVTVNPVPGGAGPITGISQLCAGTDGATYSVDSVPNAVAYVWTLPPGATIVSGNNTRFITVNYADNATSGNVTVSGNNTCGNGPASPPFPVTVIAKPATPVVTVNGSTLVSSAATGNQWYYSETQGGTGALLAGATGQTYEPGLNGYYWTIVTINGCSSDPSERIYFEIVGITDPGNTGISVFPNPCDGVFTISFDGNRIGNFMLYVTDMTGKTIYGPEVIMVDKPVRNIVDISSYSPSVYFVKLTGPGISVMKKITLAK